MSYTAEDIKREPRITAPMHPGRFLELEFLEPLGITAYRLAKDTGVPEQKMYSLVRGERGISADTALRLGRYFGLEARFWMNIQDRYELEIAEASITDDLGKIEPIRQS
jgi:addiction module HigA family antidote